MKLDLKMKPGLNRVALVVGAILLVFAVAGCGSSSGTSPSPDDSAIVSDRADSFTRDFWEARVSDISSYFASQFQMVMIYDDGSTSSVTQTRSAIQDAYSQYKAAIDEIKAEAQAQGTPLTLLATFDKTISVSGSTATVAGTMTLTVSAGGDSQSIDYPGASLTLTKSGSTWLITRWTIREFELPMTLAVTVNGKTSTAAIKAAVEAAVRSINQ